MNRLRGFFAAAGATSRVRSLPACILASLFLLAPVCGFGQGKEYIYVGGRAVAIDAAPQQAGSACPPTCGVILPTPVLSVSSPWGAAGVAMSFSVAGPPSSGSLALDYRVAYAGTGGAGHSDWIAATSTITTITCVFPLAGQFSVKAQARAHASPGIVSLFSNSVAVGVIQAPVVSGPASTMAGAQNTYTFSGVNGNTAIPFQIIPTWGDGFIEGPDPTNFASLTHAFKALGNLAVTGKAVQPNAPSIITPDSAPLVVSVTDNVPVYGSLYLSSGMGTSAWFSAGFMDYASSNAILSEGISLSGSNNTFCNFQYVVSTNTLYLSNSSGTGWAQSGTPNGSTTFTNGACQLSQPQVMTGFVTGYNLYQLGINATVSFANPGVTWSSSTFATNAVGTATVAGGSFTALSPETVSTPTTPSGPSTGQPLYFYTYSTGGSTSSYGNQVQYMFD